MQNNKHDFAVTADSFQDFEGIGKMKNYYCQVVDSTSLRDLVICIFHQEACG